MDLEQLNAHTEAASARSMEIFLARPAKLAAEAAARAALEIATGECWILQNELNSQLGQIVLAGVRHRGAVQKRWDEVWWGDNGRERIANHLGQDLRFVLDNPEEAWQQFLWRHPRAVIGQVSIGGDDTNTRDLMVHVWATARNGEGGSKRFLDTGSLPPVTSKEDMADPLGLRWEPTWTRSEARETGRIWGLDEVGIEFFVNATSEDVTSGHFPDTPACIATETFTVQTIDEVRGGLRQMDRESRSEERRSLRLSLEAAAKTVDLLGVAVTPEWHIE